MASFNCIFCHTSLTLLHVVHIVRCDKNVQARPKWPLFLYRYGRYVVITLSKVQAASKMFFITIKRINYFITNTEKNLKKLFCTLLYHAFCAISGIPMFRISRSFADLWMLRVHSLLSEVNFSSWLVYSITYGVVTFFLENLETSISHAIQKRPEKSLGESKNH